MEGIAGIVYPDIYQMGELIQPMFDSMDHRCRGSFEIHSFKNIQIGTCGGKLAANAKRTVLAGIDGYLSNAEELCKELGLSVTSTDHAAIIVHGYENWGTEFFRRLSGEFAIVIFDQKKLKILLARDPIGKKPLYWYHKRQYFIFASELKALLSTGVVPQTPAMDGIASYLYFGFIPQDLSPIEGINKLLPAHYLQYNPDGSKSITPYWSYSTHFLQNDERPKETVLKELDSLIKQSIAHTLSKNEKIGCFLSGGLGSASIAYYLSTLTPKEQITAYTAGFKGENEEDVAAAKKIAKDLGINHKTHIIDPSSFLEHLADIVWALDEPLADPNIIANWSLVDQISKDTKLVFSGMGSDELFAGHSRYSVEEQRQSLLESTLQPLYWIQKSLIPVANFLYKPLALKLMQMSRTPPWQLDYLEHNALLTLPEIAEASPKLSDDFDPEIFLSKFHNLNRIRSKVSSYLYFDVKTRLPDCYMMQFERITAAHSLSWRIPFLDKRIVEFLARLPEPEYLEEKETAAYLKSIVKGVFPESFINRPKRTRQTFLKSWLETPQMRQNYEKLKTGTLVDTGLISGEWVQAQINSLGNHPSAFRNLWAIFILELWFKLFINRSVSQAPHHLSVDQILSETS